jgi:hypothetical protein
VIEGYCVSFLLTAHVGYQGQFLREEFFLVLC